MFQCAPSPPPLSHKWARGGEQIHRVVSGMSTLAFDTLRYTERLRAAGVSEPQAKAEAEALRDVLSEALDSTFATKADIARLEASTRENFTALRGDMSAMRSEIQAQENRLFIKLGAFMTVAVGVIITILRLPH